MHSGSKKRRGFRYAPATPLFAVGDVRVGRKTKVGVEWSKLGPGDVWTGVALEDEESRKMLAEGTLVYCFGFSHSDQELLVKIEPDS
jgi:hypothetical protein